MSLHLLQGCCIVRLVICFSSSSAANLVRGETATKPSDLSLPINVDLLSSVSADLLRMFFDALYDEDVIKEEAFYKWESSKDPAEQTGKGVALKSVTAFFTWLREAEEESDKE